MFVMPRVSHARLQLHQSLVLNIGMSYCWLGITINLIEIAVAVGPYYKQRNASPILLIT